MLEVGKYSGPMEDASLGPRQSPLRLTELTFGVSHTPAPGLVELWIVVHAVAYLDAYPCNNAPQ